MTIMKNAPMNVMKMMEDSVVGQNRMESGTHASGGIGRMISKAGNTSPLNVRLDPSRTPTGIPMSWASAHPQTTRSKLTSHAVQ